MHRKGGGYTRVKKKHLRKITNVLQKKTVMVRKNECVLTKTLCLYCKKVAQPAVWNQIKKCQKHRRYFTRKCNIVNLNNHLDRHQKTTTKKTI